MNERFTSPVCYADEANDVYMGYLNQDEAIRLLGDLMLASRAIARAALTLIVDAGPEWSSFLATLHRVETRWSRQLRLAVTHMGAVPPPDVDDIYEHIMRLADPIDRFAATRDALQCVVAELDALVSRIRDETHREWLRVLRADLRAFIAQVDRLLAPPLGGAQTSPITG